MWVILYLGLGAGFAFLPACDQPSSNTPHVSPKHRGAQTTQDKSFSEHFISPQNHSQLPENKRVRLQGCSRYRYYDITANPRTDNSRGVGLQKTTRTKPMRYNEVQVYNNTTKKYVQAGHLNDNGCFDLVVPRSSDSHSLRITTRSNTEVINASVLEQIENRHYYFLELSLVPSKDHTGLSLVAQHNDKALSGAPFFYSRSSCRGQLTTAPTCVSPFS